MATPSCPKCGNTSFEMKEFVIKNANYRHYAIICSSCGTIVSTEELASTMKALERIKEKLGIS